MSRDEDPRIVAFNEGYDTYVEQTDCPYGDITSEASFFHFGRQCAAVTEGAEKKDISIPITLMHITPPIGEIRMSSAVFKKIEYYIKEGKVSLAAAILFRDDIEQVVSIALMIDHIGDRDADNA